VTKPEPVVGPLQFNVREVGVKSTSKAKTADVEKSKELDVDLKQRHLESKYYDTALRILSEEDPVKYLMHNFNNMHVGDYDAGLVMFICMAVQNIKNSHGLQPGLVGPSGSGKTSIVNAALHQLQ
jgi:ABC-type glutathione transport system ATPase component